MLEAVSYMYSKPYVWSSFHLLHQYAEMQYTEKLCFSRLVTRALFTFNAVVIYTFADLFGLLRIQFFRYIDQIHILVYVDVETSR